MPSEQLRTFPKRGLSSLLFLCTLKISTISTICKILRGKSSASSGMQNEAKNSRNSGSGARALAVPIWEPVLCFYKYLFLTLKTAAPCNFGPPLQSPRQACGSSPTWRREGTEGTDRASVQRTDRERGKTIKVRCVVK